MTDERKGGIWKASTEVKDRVWTGAWIKAIKAIDPDSFRRSVADSTTANQRSAVNTTTGSGTIDSLAVKVRLQKESFMVPIKEILPIVFSMGEDAENRNSEIRQGLTGAYQRVVKERDELLGLIKSETKQKEEAQRLLREFFLKDEERKKKEVAQKKKKKKRKKGAKKLRNSLRRLLDGGTR